MYSSSSSASQQSTVNDTANHLMRYGSAPSSLLSSTVDSIVGMSHQQHHHQQHHHHNQHHHQGYSGGESLSLNHNAPESSTHQQSRLSRSSGESKNTLTLLRSYVNDGGMTSSPQPHSSSSNLGRTSSSPAGFLNHLTSDIAGFSVSTGIDNYNSQGGSMSGQRLSRLGSQLSFTKQDQQNFLSQISEVNECGIEGISSHDHNNHKRSAASQSHSGFSLTPWDESSNGLMYSTSSSKRGKHIDEDFLNGLAAMDSQALEMANMERLLNIPQDSVPCKIRAKRGFATHPRSIAERERRTRITVKLKKLQELVPNMDKQTSYADMLDLAVEHIKGLQSQIQKLNTDLDNCTCGCKQNMHR